MSEVELLCGSIGIEGSAAL